MSITETPLDVPSIFIDGTYVMPDSFDESGTTPTSYNYSSGSVSLTFLTTYSPESTATNQNSPTNRAEVRYTLNGKNPNLGSKFWDGTAITLTGNTSGDNTVIKARVYFQGKKSPVTKVVINIY
jgi:hypothetical protein